MVRVFICCRGQGNNVLCFLQSIEDEDLPQGLLLPLESPQAQCWPSRVTHQQIWWEALEEGLKTPGILEDQHQIMLFSHSPFATWTHHPQNQGFN